MLSFDICYLMSFVYIEAEAWNHASNFFLFKIVFSIALPPTQRSLLSLQIVICSKYHVCCLSSPSHLPRYYHLMTWIKKCIFIWVMVSFTSLLIDIRFMCDPDSSVGITTDNGLNGPGSNPGGDETFRPSRPALGPTQLPVKWPPGLSRG